MRDPVADSYSNRDSDTYTHTNTNTDGDSNGYSNTNGYVYSDAETSAESTAASHPGAAPVNRSAN